MVGWRARLAALVLPEALLGLPNGEPPPVSLLLLILTDEDDYARHRLWLDEPVRSIDADTSHGLNFRVWRAVDDFAMKLNGPAMSRRWALRLWARALKQRQP